MIPRRKIRPWLTLAAAVFLAVPGAVLAAETGARVPVETFTLDNGMEFLLVHRPEMSTVAAGWVAHVGSSNERPGITGLTHLFEHMMFKGSRVIGTKNAERDLLIIEEQEKLQERIRAQYALQRDRWRRGEIDDPFDPKNRTPELVELEAWFQSLVDEQRSLMIKDEFDKIYTEAGASNMNAFTNEDMTVYFVQIPANKVELWFWMESDRLFNLVLREFYSERDVVHEERRLRTESTPTGRFDELFNSMLWQAHPYGWPVVGWPSDLRAISKAQAEEYYATYYAPNNVTAAIVGNFDPARVKDLARSYFGRRPRGPKEPPSVVTLELPQTAEMRMAAECDCQPQVQVAYKTVPFGHRDSYALDVLAGLLNGRTGRLYKSMILGKEIASSAFASQSSQKWAGAFLFAGETKGEATPDLLEQAWYEELRRIQDQPIPAEEMQKVKNQIQAGAFRRLQRPFGLMVQLLVYDGFGDWTYLNRWADLSLAVTEADVKRVASKYFTRENRTVGIYNRKAGTRAEEVPPEISALPPPAQQAVLARIRTIRSSSDAAQLEKDLAEARQRAEQAPEPFRKASALVVRAIEERLAELKRTGGEAPSKSDGGAR